MSHLHHLTRRKEKKWIVVIFGVEVVKVGVDRVEAVEGDGVRVVATNQALVLTETVSAQVVDIKNHTLPVNAAWTGFARNVERKWFENSL